jgi:hypothetical protein
MAPCGIARIDQLNAGVGGVAPIVPGDPDRQSVGVIQDFLTGHRQKGLPNLISPNYGLFGPRTTAAVRDFRAQQGLPVQDEVDVQTLQQMVQAPAAAPLLSRGYLTLVLDFQYSGLAKILSLVAQMEGAGKFSALNLNTDKAGLSFGLIQWAQKPGRLTEILRAFLTADSGEFIGIFGNGDPGLAGRLIAHTQEQHGGVDPDTGETTDPDFDLTDEPWVSRFRQAAVSRNFQPVQVTTALKDFSNSLTRMKQFAPEVKSERGVAFTLDLANQFGDGGARSIHNTVLRPGMSEADLLAAMADESVRRRPDSQARREAFLTTSFLSDGPFEAADDALAPTG